MSNALLENDDVESASRAKVTSAGQGSADQAGQPGQDAELGGLDRLQTDNASKTSLKRTLTRALAPVAAVVVLILIWQIYVWLSGNRPDVMPGPVDVAAALGKLSQQGTLWESVWTSVSRGLIGFVVSVLIGTPIGLLLA